MDFETLQRVWAGEPADRSASRAGIAEADMDQTVASVLRRSRAMRRKVLFRDAIEIVAAVGGAACFLWVSTVVPTGWPWAVAALLDLGVGGVFVADRIRRRVRRPEPSDLRVILQRSLEDVDHQVALLGSVAWWYVGPLALGAALIIGGTGRDLPGAFPSEVWPQVRLVVWVVLAVSVAITGAAFWFVWWLNQRAVRHLRRERERLAALLAELE